MGTIKKCFSLAVMVTFFVIIVHSGNLRQNDEAITLKQSKPKNCTLLDSTNRILNTINSANCTLKNKPVRHYCSAFNVNNSTGDLAFGILYIFLTVVGIIGNTAVCLVIVRDNQLRSEVINWFLFSLAFSDILVCSVSFPFNIHVIFHNQTFCFGLAACYIYILTDLISNASSIVCLACISVNRYFAILYPLTHSLYISRKKAGYMILLCWCLPIILSMLGTFNWRTGQLSIHIETVNGNCLNSNSFYYVILYTIFFIVPLLLMGIVYVFIVNIMRQRTTTTQDKTQRGIMQRTEWKVTKTVCVVYGVFIICWLPISTINVITWSCPDCFPTLRIKYPTIFMFIFTVFVQCLPQLSAVLHPFIYVLCGKRYRQALRKTFTFKRTNVYRRNPNYQRAIQVTSAMLNKHGRLGKSIADV